MNDKLKTASRASCLMVLALALGGPRFVAASDALERVPPVGEPPSQAATNLPPLLRPATLTDAEGTPETGLVDPFRRRGEGLAGEPTESAPGKDGLLRTSLGEISREFRILAILVNVMFIYIPQLSLWKKHITLFHNEFDFGILDGIALAVAIILFIFYLSGFFRDIRYFSRIDPLKKEKEDR